MANKLIIENCPSCGNEVELPKSMRPGDVRHCPYCKIRFLVTDGTRTRKKLEEYLLYKETHGEAAVKALSANR